MRPLLPEVKSPSDAFCISIRHDDVPREAPLARPRDQCHAFWSFAVFPCEAQRFFLRRDAGSSKCSPYYYYYYYHYRYYYYHYYYYYYHYYYYYCYSKKFEHMQGHTEMQI